MKKFNEYQQTKTGIHKEYKHKNEKVGKMEDKNQRDIKLNDFQKYALIIYFFRKEENRTKHFSL